MAGAEAAADSSGPRFAPDDPTLPAPWKGLIDGATLYYWNPETNVTQYDRPAAAAPPLPAAAPPSVPGGFAQPGVQLGQVGQVAQQERLGQQQQPQQPAQQLPFQYQAQQAQQVPYQQQQQEQMPNQQMSQQPLAPQYSNTHPQPMPYQHGPYMQPQQQGQQYSYQLGQQPQMPQTPYNQGQQLPIPQAANQGQQPTMPLSAYNQGQRPPMPQAPYSQGQRPPMPQAAYNQGQQPQMPHAAYNQGQQLQGMRIPQSQVQHTQQSPGFHQPAQAPQVMQASQSQGLQMSPQQGQLQHGFQFTPQQGKQLHHGHVGAHLSQLSHGQQNSAAKVDAGGHEGKQTGFSLPPGQQRGQAPISNQPLPSNHQRPESHNQLNIHGVGGPAYPAKLHLGGSSPGETNNMSYLSSPAQAHQGGVDTNYRHQLASSHVVPNHIAPSPGRPPMGFKVGNSEDQFEKNELHSSSRFDGIHALQQQPKLAALPPSQNRLQDMRNGPPYPQPDNFGGYNMAPPHSVQNPHNHGPFPVGASMRPPPGTFSPPDFPSVASVDAYRQHHEVTAVGENVPPPFMTFEATGFPPEILRENIKCG